MPASSKVRAAAKCGHEVTDSLPRWQHPRWVEHTAGNDCRKCIRAAENAQSTLDAKKAGLPALVGQTERQRAYGETCRAKALEKLVDLQNADEPLPTGMDVMLPVVERTEAAAFRGMMLYVSEQTGASFWCDCGQMTLPDMIDYIMERMGLGKRTSTGFQPVDGYLEKAAAIVASGAGGKQDALQKP